MLFQRINSKPKFPSGDKKEEYDMDIYLTVLIGLLGLCVGAIIGLGIDFKINHTYILEMIDLEKGYFDTITTDLAKAVDEINKVYEKPIWRKTEEELPLCSGLYYGKIKDNPHGENAMWKVVYNDNEWSLSGYPDNKVEISEWTEIY